jgi:hypothetical protein
MEIDKKPPIKQSVLSSYIRGFIFSYIDERHFISVATLLLGLVITNQNAQIHSDSLWSQINLLIVTTILMVSIIRGMLALLTARTGSYDKISPSFKDTQYTFFGHVTTIIVSFSSGVLLGYFIKDTANSFLLGFLIASIMITVLESIVSKPMKYEDEKNIWIQ